MPTSSSSPNQGLVGQVVAEWRERMLRGERFELNEYTAQYPQIAAELQARDQESRGGEEESRGKKREAALGIDVHRPVRLQHRRDVEVLGEIVDGLVALVLKIGRWLVDRLQLGDLHIELLNRAELRACVRHVILDLLVRVGAERLDCRDDQRAPRLRRRFGIRASKRQEDLGHESALA